MSFREKSAWIAVICTLAIWGFYFLTFSQNYFDGALDGRAIRDRFILCFGVTIVVMLALNIVSARLGHHRFGADPDERERTMERRARSIEIVLLELGALAVAVAGLLNFGLIAAAYPADPAGSTAIVIANAILFVVIFAQVAYEAALIVQFRMMD